MQLLLEQILHRLLLKEIKVFCVCLLTPFITDYTVLIHTVLCYIEFVGLWVIRPNKKNKYVSSFPHALQFDYQICA